MSILREYPLKKLKQNRSNMLIIIILCIFKILAEIRILEKVPDPTGSGFTTLVLMKSVVIPTHPSLCVHRLLA